VCEPQRSDCYSIMRPFIRSRSLCFVTYVFVAPRVFSSYEILALWDRFCAQYGYNPILMRPFVNLNDFCSATNSIRITSDRAFGYCFTPSKPLKSRPRKDEAVVCGSYLTPIEVALHFGSVTRGSARTPRTFQATGLSSSDDKKWIGLQPFEHKPDFKVRD